MSQRKATDVFSEWAEAGRDEGMERGHGPSVEVMLERVLATRHESFTAIDIGCGNGWVVRKLLAHPLCTEASGVDGASAMIEKAKSIHPDGDYTEAMLPDWKPEKAVDMLHSMECLYYLHDPLSFLKTLHADWLNAGGSIVIGVDHYLENPSSHDWPESLNVHMTTLSIAQWRDGMTDAGFTDVITTQTGAKEGWAGTLIITASKP
ncbi:MAG: class I SAM-dependent methyltransferase [Candidatus Poseidonia sp.]|nr:class I SAM-dependent methyltransferase [Poseidonia sp.]MBL6747407.1 class I SAM-dependent methyltransferase [Poseidonia sp.]MBL6806695.1 class I SAM-dependent methyltransferase [Poseidonia sp.]MBL6885887.1 class I SAM-dependent methyltransferase [Poseidonia sp.]MBL6892263.1 class I SAM-dependent methyltransferase [Poseidonia sp.]